MPKFDVEVTPPDGNAFGIIGATMKALRKEGASQEEISQYQSEATSGDYDNLLRVTMDWVNLNPSE